MNSDFKIVLSALSTLTPWTEANFDVFQLDFQCSNYFLSSAYVN